ncbi:MAG TPA: YggT family protein [Actinobacteria bacterium]|nr:YggT family protein [Actinomycetota bacterium]
MLKNTVFQLVDLSFTVYNWLIILRIILSWFPLPSTGTLGSIYRFIYELTEPLLAIFRRILSPIMVGSVGLDLSPIIVLILLRFLRGLILMAISQIFMYI